MVIVDDKLAFCHTSTVSNDFSRRCQMGSASASFYGCSLRTRNHTRWTGRWCSRTDPWPGSQISFHTSVVVVESLKPPVTPISRASNQVGDKDWPVVRVCGCFVATDGASQGTVAIRLVQRYLLSIDEYLANVTIGDAFVRVFRGTRPIGVHSMR